MEQVKNMSVFAKFDKPMQFNSQFHKVKVYVAYAGDNRNYSSISKETFEKMIPSIFGVPVLGEWSKSDKSFKGHGGKIEITDDGIEYIDTTKPYGFVDSNANVWWENVTEEDGMVREYLCTEAFLWTGRYPEALTVLDGRCNQSMELTVKDGEYRDDGYFEIKDAIFSALTILGEEIEPCFESGSFKQFSLRKDVFMHEFNLMVNELKSSLKGGEEENMENKEFENENIEVNNTEEVVEIEAEKVDASVEQAEEPIVDTTEEFESTTEEKESVVNVEEVAVDEDEQEVQEDTVESTAEEVVETVEEFDYKVAYEELQSTHAKSTEEIENLKVQYNQLEQENSKLKEQLSTYQLKEREEQIETVFSQFEGEFTEDEIADIKENCKEFTLDELEKELFALLGRKKFSKFSKVEKKDKPIVTIKETSVEKMPYGSLSRYFNK